MSKGKISKKILIPILIAVLVIGLTCSFFLIKNRKKTNSTQQPVNYVNSLANIEKDINIAVLNKNCPTSFNGLYKYNSIYSYSFDERISESDKEIIFNSLIGVYDENAFFNYLVTTKNNSSNNEILTFLNGKYSKSINETRTEYGVYYGNDDKSYVYKRNNSGSIELDGLNYSIAFEISKTGYWLNNIVSLSNNEIFIKEKMYFSSKSDKYVEITYLYKMIEK